MKQTIKSVLEKDFIYYVNLIVRIILDAILVAFLFLLVTLSLLIIYFSQNENKFSRYVQDQFISTLKKQGADSIEIQEFNTDFALLYFEVSASNFYVKFTNDFNLEVENGKVKIYYLPLFFLKLKTKIDADFISFVDLPKKERKMNQQFNIENSLLIFFRSANINIKHLKVKDVETVNFTDITFFSKINNNKEGELTIKGDTFFYFVNPEKKTKINFNCTIQALTKCDINMLNLESEQLIKINTLIGTSLNVVQNYFLFERANVSELSIKLVSKNRNIKNLFAELKFDDLAFKLPFLASPNDFEIASGSTIITQEDSRYIASFDFLLEDKKEISGKIKYDAEDVAVDIYGKNFEIEDVSRYWPSDYLFDVKEFLESSIKTAKTEYVKVHVSKPKNKPEDFKVDVKFYDASLHYSSLLPDVENASGIVTVDVSDEILIKVDKATSGNINIKNAKAIFNTETDLLKISTDFIAEVQDIIKFFTGTKNISALEEGTEGLAEGNFDIAIYVQESPQKMFEDTKFNANFNIYNFKTPTVSYNSVVKMKAKKYYSSSQIEFAGESNGSSNLSTACKATIDSLKFDLFLNLDSGIVNMQDIILQSKTTDIKGDISANFLKEDFFNFFSFYTVKFCNNDFSVFFNHNTHNLQLYGYSLNLPELEGLNVYNFYLPYLEKQKKDILIQKLKNTYLDIQINNLFLFHNEHFTDVIFQNKYGKFIDATGKKDGNEFFKITKNNSALIIFAEDASQILNGFMKQKPQLEGGKLLILGKVIQDGEIQGTLQLQNYTLVTLSEDGSSVFDFSSKELKSEFETKGDLLKIVSLRFANIFHTVNIYGDINMKTDELFLTAVYTPSSLDVNNLLDVVYLKDIFNTVTFGAIEKGILSLLYDIRGTILEPKIKFNGTETSKNLAKTGTKVLTTIVLVNLILLPLVGVILLIF